MLFCFAYLNIDAAMIKTWPMFCS